MRRRVAAWASVAPLLGVVACANVWGFQDSTASDGGPPDATSMSDTYVAVSEAGGGDAEADAAEEEGDSAPAVGDDARTEGEAGKAGDGGGVSREGGPGDGGDAGDGAVSAVVAACEAACMGCCDAQGLCHTTPSTTVCGPSGTECQNCSAHKCAITETPCCATSGCGCATLSLICN